MTIVDLDFLFEINVSDSSSQQLFFFAWVEKLKETFGIRFEELILNEFKLQAYWMKSRNPWSAFAKSLDLKLVRIEENKLIS
jgi:hypothetical protein